MVIDLSSLIFIAIKGDEMNSNVSMAVLTKKVVMNRICQLPNPGVLASYIEEHGNGLMDGLFNLLFSGHIDATTALHTVEDGEEPLSHSYTVNAFDKTGYMSFNISDGGVTIELKKETKLPRGIIYLELEVLLGMILTDLVRQVYKDLENTRLYITLHLFRGEHILMEY